MQEKDLADGRVAMLVFVHVKLGELQHLLDANAGATKNLDNGEAPEGVFLLLHHVDAVGTARSTHVGSTSGSVVCRPVQGDVASDGDQRLVGRQTRSHVLGKLVPAARDRSG